MKPCYRQLLQRGVRVLALIVIAGWFLGLPAVQAQKVDPVKAYDEGVAALETGDIKGGLAIVDAVLEAYAENGLQRYGPAFGHFHYLRGMLLIRQKDYEGAIRALRTAYDDFGNNKKKLGQAPNVFHVHALMQWGLSLQAQEKYAEAAEKFEKTLKEDPRTEPRINRLAVEMNLGRCYLRMGREEEGRALLNQMLDLEGLPDDAIQDAFTVLAAEGAEMNVMDAVRRNAGALVGSEEDRAVMNPRFASLAARALADGNPLQALVWYNLMTPPHRTLADKEERLAAIQSRLSQVRQQQQPPNVQKRMENAVATVEKEITELRQQHGNALLGMAAAHYQVGSLSAAYGVYRRLVDHHPEVGDRAQLLHNLVICATNLSRWDEADAYGQQFSREFPKHELQASLNRILTEITSVRGNHDRALAMANSARHQMTAGSAEREPLDFIAALSLYQQNQFEGAETEFLAFLENYPESVEKPGALFHLGSARVKLSRWSAAIPALNRYVDDYPRHVSRPVALYLLSLAHLITENPHEAVVRANHLLAQHGGAPQTAGAHNVKGDAQAVLGEDYETVVASYLRARTAALRQGQAGFETAAYALKQLTATAVEAEQWDTALTHFAEFKERYQKSVWKVDAIVSVLPALIATGQKAEGRALLEELVLSSGSGLDENFRAYTDFLQRHYTPGEQLGALRDFSAADSPALNSWRTIGQVEILERAEEPDASRIDALFQELNGLFERSGEDLGSYALVRLARWQGEVQRDEAAATRIYDFILSDRPTGEARGIALVDTARLDFLSGKAERIAQAKVKFEQALNQFDAGEVRELAVLGLARIATVAEDWETAQPLWERYLESRAWRQARAEANFNYALCLDRRNRTNEALKVYIAVYANFPKDLDWSTQAYLRAAGILWNRGQNLDALKVLQDMLRRFEGVDHPGVAQAEQQFFQWRDEYIASQNR